MDGYEATRMVLSRIQNVDPENASKIMGMLLIQDHGEKEMIRLAFGPEALLHSVIMKARKDLGIPSNSPTTPSSQSPFLSTNPVAISRQSSAASRLMSSTGATFSPTNISSPSSSALSTWAALSDLQNREDLSSSSIYGNGSNDSMIDAFQLQDQLSFLNDGSPNMGPANPDLIFPPTADMLSSPAAWGGPVHRRSYSVSDACLGSEDPCSGIGWKPCLYHARGFCKNGSTCRFLHGGPGDTTAADGGAQVVGSPSKMDFMGQCHELLRSKSTQQQRLAAASQLLGSPTFPYSPKSLNLLMQQQQTDAQRAAAAVLMMSENMYKFGRSRLERSDFSINGMVNPASRQIYLTFPADSSFREEDVSNYFSIYGPVQDVRIPYQQKRMFGFVTFVYPDTVKLILAKGNPHFVCDARVLVKPYKEKGKVPDKYRKLQQPMERGEFSPCGTPTGLDSRGGGGPFDLQLGARSFYNSQDMLWRRKMEQEADLQQAIELHSQRLMNLQLLDVKKHHHHRALSTGSPIPSPTRPSNLFNQAYRGFPENGMAPILTTGSDKGSYHSDEVELPESLEHNLPDSPFASPMKSSSTESPYAFSSKMIDTEGDDKSATSASNNNPVTSAVDMAACKSFNCQIPSRFSATHGALGLYAGPSGSTYPVGV